MQRRRFLETLAAGSAAAAWAGAGRKPETGNGPKRNVLFIAIDDLKPLLSCYGVAGIKTPNVDRLAAHGTVFLNNHCQQAVCGPSRASLMTGLRPDKTGVWDLKTRMRDVHPDVLSLPQYLRNRGFETVGMGKIYDPRCVDKKLDPPSWSVPYKKNFSPADYPADPGAPVLSSYQSPRVKALEKEAKAKGLSGYKEIHDYLFEHDAWPVTECEDVPDEAYIDGAIRQSGVKWLRRLKKGGKPFFLAVGFKKPHLPFVAPKKYWDLYDRDAIELAPYQKKSEHPVEYAYHGDIEISSYTGIPRFDSYSSDPSKHLPAKNQRELIHGYRACVSYVDAQIGKLLDELEALGLAENTSVVLWGDHGWHLGDHGMWCKHSDFENATRSPLIVAVPDGKAAKTSAPTEFVDVFPTVCELAGVPVPEGLDGTSLTPLLKDPAAEVKPYAVSQWPRGGNKKGAMGYALRDRRYRYVEWMKGGWRTTDPFDPSKVAARELYDYEKDPLETVNVADDPAYADVRERLEGELHAFYEAQRK